MCDHPSIIKLLSSFGTKNKLIFVMEYAPNGDLEFFLKKFGTLNLELARIYAAEIINVLDYLHNTLHLSHRDLKPSNVILDANFHLKLVNTLYINHSQID